MRLLLVVAAALVVVGVASAAEQPVRVTPGTEIRLIHYRAHDGQIGRRGSCSRPATTGSASRS